MAHLAHRTYRPRPPHHVFFDGKAAPATVSPAHLVFMHGLFGNNRNFAPLGASMAGLDSDQRLLAEAKLGLTSVHERMDPKLTARVALPKAATPRVYTTTAFDWRNHGDSPHNPKMNLDGLAEDLASYLEEYATRLRYEQLGADKHSAGIECCPIEGAPLVVPPTNPLARDAPPLERMATQSSPTAAAALVDGLRTSPPGEPLPLILAAHSMGAMALMHWLWREHVNIWAHNIFLGDDSPYLQHNVFQNQHYRVIGAVIIDMAPSTRPESFNETIRIIDFLPQTPLHQLRTPQEVEKWLLEKGPQDVFNQHHIFQIRYHISNIDYTDPARPRWRIGLQEIIGGLHEILWEEGGIASMQQARDALMVANRRRIAEHKRIWESPRKFDAFPTYFIFGKDSPYNNPLAHQGIYKHFYRPHVLELDKADHFLFMRHKSTFMEQLRNFCYDAEVKANMVR